ncbi:hypothetical protein KY285_024373 [Solanum tuberosum]|nr:hypothetical protein KY285_024373 [Solanum tuberosum]
MPYLSAVAELFLCNRSTYSYPPFSFLSLFNCSNGAASNMELLTCLLGYSCLKIEKRSKELRLFELACNR